MSKHLWYCVALFSLIPAAPVFGEEPVTLKWRFVKEWPIHHEITTESTTKLKSLTFDNISSDEKETLFLHWTPMDKNANGGLKIKLKIDGAKYSEKTTGSTPVSFDSTIEGIAPAAGDAVGIAYLKALMADEFTCTFTKDMQVTKFDDADGVLKKAGSANETRRLIMETFGDSALRALADASFLPLPSKAVKVGDSWERISVFDMGTAGTYEYTSKYTYRGTSEDNVAQIRVECNVKYLKPGRTASGGVPFRITKADLKSRDADGVILFDNRTGRLESADLSFESGGTMEYEVGGTKMKMEMEQKLHVKLKNTGPAPPEEPKRIEPSPAPDIMCYQPCPCRHPRLFWRLRRCR